MSTTPTWSDEPITMIEDCEKRESKLTDWERQFVDSLKAQITEGRRPTTKQSETLDDIWEKATS